MRIGGNWTCRQCGKYCMSGTVHDCPEEKKQKRMSEFMPENRIEVTCPTCKKKRMIPMSNKPFFGDIRICGECRKKRDNIFWSSKG